MQKKKKIHMGPTDLHNERAAEIYCLKPKSYCKELSKINF